MSNEEAVVSSLGIVFILILIALIFFLYFIPTFVAFSRRHQFKWIIFLINFFAGFTFVAWIGALIWSLIDTDQSTKVYIQPAHTTPDFSIASEIEKLTILRDNGDISNIEYRELKYKLLEKYNKGRPEDDVTKYNFCAM